jgi:hypothetical protein
MAKKKQTLVYNYKKQNDAENISKKDFIEYINESKELYLLQEAFYDDGTQSFTIQVHFTAKQPKR